MTVVTRPLIQPALLFFKTAALTNSILIDIDLKTGKCSRKQSRIALAVHWTMLLLLLVKDIVLAYGLIRKVANYESEDLVLVIIFAVLCTLYYTATLWCWELFHRHITETIQMFNMLDFENIANGLSPLVPLRENKFQKLVRLMTGWKNTTTFSMGLLLKIATKLNAQEALMLITPPCGIVFFPAIPLLAFIGPHWEIFTIAHLPAGSPSWAYFVLMVLETLVAIFSIHQVFFLFYFELASQVMHFTKMADLVDDMKERSRTATTWREMEQLFIENLKILKSYSVYLVIFNVSISLILFTGKIMALICSVLCTYYFLTCYDTGDPVLVFFSVCLGIQAVAFYIISCKRLQEFPENAANLQRECYGVVNKMQVARVRRARAWLVQKERELRYRIRAVPRLGIKEAGLRCMESVSSLAFIDFYLNQVISLLVM